MTNDPRDTSKYGSDPGGLWAAADLDSDSFGGPAERAAWTRAVEADFPADGDVMCDPRTFMPDEDFVDVSLAVLGFAPDRTATALANAAARMMLVTVDGKEYEDFDDIMELEAEADDEDDAYTPNYISGPQRVGDLVGLSNIDTKGERYPWMFRTFLRIVAEELRDADAVPAKIVPFPRNR